MGHETTQRAQPMQSSRPVIRPWALPCSQTGMPMSQACSQRRQSMQRALIHLHAIEAGVVQEPEGGAVGAQIAAVEAVAGERHQEEAAEIGEADGHPEGADQGDRPGVGGNWVATITAAYQTKNSHFTWRSRHTQGPAQGLAAVGEADGLADPHAGTAKAADDPPPEQEDQGQDQDEAQGPGRMQGREDRLGPEETDVGLEEGREPGDQPPQDRD